MTCSTMYQNTKKVISNEENGDVEAFKANKDICIKSKVIKKTFCFKNEKESIGVR